MVTPTGYTALDLVGFTDKGPYSALENYVKNDLAHYAGSIWRCKIDDTTNVTPAENANWTVFVSEPSNLVEASIAPIETSPATAAHAQGSQLFYNDTLYKAKTAIAIGDSLVVDTNIEAAPKVTTQLEAKANTADLGTAAGKDSTDAVTQNDTDLVESGAVYTAVGAVASRVDTVDANFAPVESGSTASQAYAIGEQFVKGDVLYKAKTAIAQGDTLTLNTNYEAADNITDQLGSVNEALTNVDTVISENGAKNLCPNIATDVVRNGITWTVNDNGTIHAKYTATANSEVTVSTFSKDDPINKVGATLILSGCPSSGAVNKYFIYANTYNRTTDEYVNTYYDVGESVQIQPSSTEYIKNVYCKVINNQTVDIEFRPMITLASQPNSDYAHYVPYAKTNRELTEDGYIRAGDVIHFDLTDIFVGYSYSSNEQIRVYIPLNKKIVATNVVFQKISDGKFFSSDGARDFASVDSCLITEHGVIIYMKPNSNVTTYNSFVFRGEFTLTFS